MSHVESFEVSCLVFGYSSLEKPKGRVVNVPGQMSIATQSSTLSDVCELGTKVLGTQQG